VDPVWYHGVGKTSLWKCSKCYKLSSKSEALLCCGGK
jgi:hypothetical protein